MREVPWGFRKLLVWIRDQYDNPVVYVNENGVSDDEEHFGKLDDEQRIRYHENYINNVLKGNLYMVFRRYTGRKKVDFKI